MIRRVLGAVRNRAGLSSIRTVRRRSQSKNQDWHKTLHRLMMSHHGGTVELDARHMDAWEPVVASRRALR